MGVDACIYIKLKANSSFDVPLHDSIELVTLDNDHDCVAKGATHRLDTLWRYYSKTYARGYWPQIAALLMALYSSLAVEAVWYFADNYSSESLDPFTQAELLEMTSCWMAWGNRAYSHDKCFPSISPTTTTEP